MSDKSFAESLLTRFVVPLVFGKDAHVGAPLLAAGATRLVNAAKNGLDKTHVAKTLHAGRTEQLLALGCLEPTPSLADDPHALVLAAGLHDLLFLAHPEATRLKPERRSVIARGARLLFEQARLDTASTTLAVLCGRHALTGRLWRLLRDDVRRDDQIFKGTSPPRRWFAGDAEPDLVERVAVAPELLGLCDGAGGQAVRVLLLSSPLTDLLEPTRNGLSVNLPVELLAQARWLRRKDVARLVVRRYLELGLPAAFTPILQPLYVLLENPQAQDAVALWLGLFCHLHLLFHVAARAPLPVPGSAALSEDGSDFYALYAALFEARPALAMPSDVAADFVLRTEALQHKDRCRALVSSLRVRELAALLAAPAAVHSGDAHAL